MIYPDDEGAILEIAYFRVGDRTIRLDRDERGNLWVYCYELAYWSPEQEAYCLRSSFGPDAQYLREPLEDFIQKANRAIRRWILDPPKAFSHWRCDAPTLY